MEQHEKTINMGFMMLMIVIIIIAFVVIALQWAKGQEFAGTSIEFNSLCVQWQYKDCEMVPLNDAIEDALEKIDNTQKNNGKPTLTEECFKLFDMGSDIKTKKLCQDICKNKCNPQISYDIAVYKENIKFMRANSDGTRNIEIEILNLGSGSVFGAYVKITGNGGGKDIPIYSGYIDAPSHESWIKTFEPEEPITYVIVDMDDYKDADQDNNVAENEL